MKRYTVLLLFSTLGFLSCKDPGVQSPESEIEPPLHKEYYWAGGNKIELIMNRKTVIGVYRPDSAFPDRWLEIIHFDEYQLAPLRTIVAERGFDPDSFEWLSFGYTYQGAEILPTNHICISFLPGYTLHSIDTLIQNDAVFNAMEYNVITLRVTEQEGNVFQIANRVQESGLVNYSTPDFVTRIGQDD
jgi:hypothetical protein